MISCELINRDKQSCAHSKH